MAPISELHQKWMKEPKYRKAYEALEEEFALASALIGVRNRAGLTQKQLARKMGTTQTVVARLESGRARPSMRTLERLANATGSRLLITFGIALRTPFPWPHGVPTRPEIDQGKGGTRPSDWVRDCEKLRNRITTFSTRRTFGIHPMFGKMSRSDWLAWGYRHVDHHLRQFGV